MVKLLSLLLLFSAVVGEETTTGTYGVDMVRNLDDDDDCVQTVTGGETITNFCRH